MIALLRPFLIKRTGPNRSFASIRPLIQSRSSSDTYTRNHSYLASGFMPHSLTAAVQQDSDRPPDNCPLRRLRTSELFSNLLLNRESLYQTLQGTSQIKGFGFREESSNRLARVQSEERVIPSIETKQEEDMNMGGFQFGAHLNRRKESQSGNSPAGRKFTGQLNVAANKRRNPPTLARSGRGSKTRKTTPTANSGKRVNGKGISEADPFVISDDEDDIVDTPCRKARTETLTPPVNCDLSPDEDDIKPNLDAAPVSTECNIEEESELKRVRAAHTLQVEELQRLLDAAETRTRHTREQLERNAFDSQRQRSVRYEKHKAEFQEELEIERKHCIGLSWECDYLRRQLETVKSSQNSKSIEIQQRDGYERLYHEQCDVIATLTHEIAEQNTLSIDTAAGLRDEIQRLAGQVLALEREISFLKAANDALTASIRVSSVIASPSSTSLSHSPLVASPYPLLSSFTPSRSSSVALSTPPSPLNTQSASQSQSPTPTVTSSLEQEKKFANMRRTYLDIKKRYDELASAASRLRVATSGLDTGAFGEFGRCLRELGNVLDRNKVVSQG